MSIHFPDKVWALRHSIAANARAIREARFIDAKRHARATKHLTADLRDERGQR